MANNEFKPFAALTNANVISQEEYERLAALKVGFGSGVAVSEQLNKVWRQSSVMSNLIAEFIAEQLQKDVKDDGDLSRLKQQFNQALTAFVLKQQPADSLLKSQNLADLPDNAEARENLGLGEAALMNHSDAFLDELVGEKTEVVDTSQLVELRERVKKVTEEFTYSEKTVLFTGDMAEGDIPLAESPAKFDEIIIISTDDRRYNAAIDIKPVWVLKEIVDNQPAYSFSIRSTMGSYWSIMSNSFDSQLWRVFGGNSRILKIFGVNHTFKG